jgi:sarcosine oxidase subunit gamma
MADLARFGVLDGAGFTAPAVGFAAVPAATRFNLRARGAAVAAAGEAFGVALPLQACRAATHRDRAALWLGPDEFLLLAPNGETEAIAGAMEAALAGQPHSLVDWSHRLAGLEIGGPAAATVLAEACPLDLDLAAFPVDMCTRTVFAKAEIILWRIAEDRFRVEVARSFAPYLRGFLEEVCGEYGA